MTVKVSKAINDQWVIARGMKRVGGPFDSKQAAIKAARREAEKGERIVADIRGSFSQEVIREGSGGGSLFNLF